METPWLFCLFKATLISIVFASCSPCTLIHQHYARFSIATTNFYRTFIVPATLPYFSDMLAFTLPTQLYIGCCARDLLKFKFKLSPSERDTKATEAYFKCKWKMLENGWNGIVEWLRKWIKFEIQTREASLATLATCVGVFWNLPPETQQTCRIRKMCVKIRFI